MNELKQLDGIIGSELGKTDYKGVSEVVPSTELYSAQVDLENHRMKFGFNLNKKESRSNRKIVARDLSNHEYGHLGGEIKREVIEVLDNQGAKYALPNVDIKKAFRDKLRIQEIREKVVGIPGTVENSEELFMDPMYGVLSKKGFSIEDVHYVENCLEDTLLHFEGSQRRSWDGVTRFFETQSNFSEFYDAHVRLNMMLWGNLEQRAKMKEKYTGSKKAVKAVSNFLKRTRILEKRINSKDELKSYLLDETNWGEISKIYAEEFSKLMTPNYARPTINHNGAGTKGRETEDSSNQGNVFQRQRKTDGYKKERVRRAYEKGEKIPGWMSKTENEEVQALDLLYDSFVGDLEIIAESETIQDSLPIANIISKEFDPLVDSDADAFIDINELGQPSLYISRQRLELPQQIKVGSKGFPKAKFVMSDSSVSMKEGINKGSPGRTTPIPWGDKSKYHYSVVARKALLKFLIENGFLVDQDSVEMDDFSTNTIIYKGLDEVKRGMYGPQWDNTYLNAERVKQVFSGEDNLIVLISDGEIANWGDVKSDFIEGAKRNHYFHFQMGKDSEATAEMKANGLQVENCRGDEDLVHKVIDLRKKIKLDNTA